MLNELDKELERRGLRFVRFVDDCMIFCRSKRSAQRAMDNIVAYIEGKLFELWPETGDHSNFLQNAHKEDNRLINNTASRLRDGKGNIRKCS